MWGVFMMIVVWIVASVILVVFVAASYVSLLSTLDRQCGRPVPESPRRSLGD